MQSEISPVAPKYLQQEEIVSQECMDLISTLPKERGWVVPHMYQYQSFWYAPKHLEGVISCQKHFQVQDSDIFLVTTPKSGTTWLKAIMFTLANRTRIPVSTKNHPLLSNNPHDLVPFMEIDLFVDNKIPDVALLPAPRVFSTHLPYVSLPESIKKNSECKLVYLCRSPKDIFVSIFKFTNKLRLPEMGSNSREEKFDMFCRGISLYGPVWDHVLEYWNKSKEIPDKVFFLRYEDMKEQPGVHLRRLAEFLKCPFSAEEEKEGMVEKILNLCSFDSLSSLEVNRSGKLSNGVENKAFFRRGVVGDWKNVLTTEMVEKLNQITEKSLMEQGLCYS